MKTETLSFKTDFHTKSERMKILTISINRLKRSNNLKFKVQVLLNLFFTNYTTHNYETTIYLMQGKCEGR